MTKTPIAVLGIDLGKNSCSLAGLDAAGAVIMRRRMTREGRSALQQPPPEKLLHFFGQIRQECWFGSLRGQHGATLPAFSCGTLPSAAKIMRMSDNGVGEVPAPALPGHRRQTGLSGCGCTICYACPRSTTGRRWRCKACCGGFITSALVRPAQAAAETHLLPSSPSATRSA